MFRWLVITLLALMLFGGLRRWLSRFGFGHLPGDFRIRFGAREIDIPLGSCVVLTVLAGLVGKLL